MPVRLGVYHRAMDVRLALCPINPTVGDIPGNAGAIRRAIEALPRGAAAPDVIALPELAMCGYPPRDLIWREGFVAACEAQADTLAREIAADPDRAGATIIVGCPVRAEFGGVANALVAHRGGERVLVYRKRLLPTYDVFDEDRYFVPGDRPGVLEVPTRAGGSVRVGLAICEDLWRGEDAGFASRYASSVDPVADLVAHGAQLVVSPSASPFVLGKAARHGAIVAGHARRHGVPVASLNQLGGNDDLVFDGHAMVLGPAGPLAMGRPFRGDALLARLDGARGGSAATADDADEMALLFEALVLGVRDYAGKTGFKAAVLGLSGGIDSALTAAIAVAALGPTRVTGIAMPGPYSSEHSVSDARALAANLGMPLVMLPIEAGFRGMAAMIDDAFARERQPRLGERLPDLAEENLQSRVRGTALMAWSNRTGALVLTTGNKSELAVGYCTLYGDMNGGLAVLSDLTKGQVYRLSRWINQHATRHGWFAGAGPMGGAGSKAEARPIIPEGSLSKPPSAELRPNQTDQDSLPPYDEVDAIVERVVEGHQSPERIARETGIDPAVVRRVVRLMELSEYKRRQAALGLKVTTVAFGPGRRQPIVHRWS